MSTLIKISDAHYIVVGENPDKMYEGWYELDSQIFNTSKYMLQNGCRVVTHSTQPLEEVVWWERETRKSKLGFDKIKPLSLSEVEETVYGYSVEKMAEERGKNKFGTQLYIDYFTEGFKAHQELSKDKLFTVDDMRNAFNAGSKRTYICEADGKDKKCYCKSDDDCDHRYYLEFEDYIKSILPPTEWDVEFIDNKIKLV